MSSYFDIEIITFLNQFAQQSTIFDKALVSLSTNNLLKGGVIMALFFYLWFSSKNNNKTKLLLLTSLFTSSFAMFLTRIISIFSSYSPRPLHSEEIVFILPFGIEKELFSSWSSFPSDHATLFFSISFAMFLVYKKVGTIALLYTTIFICFPRVYLGLHFPIDIFVGAIIAIVSSFLIYVKPLRAFIYTYVYSLQKKSLGIFHALLFLFTFQIAEMFNSTRAILKALYEFFKSIGFL